MKSTKNSKIIFFNTTDIFKYDFSTDIEEIMDIGLILFEFLWTLMNIQSP